MNSCSLNPKAPKDRLRWESYLYVHGHANIPDGGL